MTPDGTSPPLPRPERQIAALGELVDIGLKLARAIERQADAAADGPQPIADLNAAAMAYARVARAVRQTVMLQTRLTEAAQANKARAGDVRARIARIVRDAIEAEQDDGEQVERLAAEAAERLEQESYDDLLARPVAEIVADICKALGLKPDWPGLEADIAAVQALARGDPGGTRPSPEDETGPIELYWLQDGKPVPAPRPRFDRQYRPSAPDSS